MLNYVDDLKLIFIIGLLMMFLLQEVIMALDYGLVSWKIRSDSRKFFGWEIPRRSKGAVKLKEDNLKAGRVNFFLNFGKEKLMRLKFSQI